MGPQRENRTRTPDASHVITTDIRGFNSKGAQPQIMYSVVGCGACGALKIVEGEPKTTGCPRCGKRLTFRKLRKFAQTDDPDAARQARAELLADRQDHGERFATLDSFVEMEDQTDRDIVDDVTYLESGGIDPDEVAQAARRAEGGKGTSGGGRKETIHESLRALDQPTESEIVDYAEERGVPPEYVRKALQKLVRAGEVTETNGRYRTL